MAVETRPFLVYDSFYLDGNTFLFYGEAERKKINFHPNYRLYELTQPYHIIKKSNNDTLTVIQNYDTLYFKFYGNNKTR